MKPEGKSLLDIRDQDYAEYFLYYSFHFPRLHATKEFAMITVRLYVLVSLVTESCLLLASPQGATEARAYVMESANRSSKGSV